MSNIETGVNTTTQGKEKAEQTVMGSLSLRDYFAAKIVPAYTGSEAINNAIHNGEMTIDDAAKACYVWADALLKAREA